MIHKHPHVAYTLLTSTQTMTRGIQLNKKKYSEIVLSPSIIRLPCFSKSSLCRPLSSTVTIHLPFPTTVVTAIKHPPCSHLSHILVLLSSHPRSTSLSYIHSLISEFQICDGEGGGWRKFW